MQALLNEHGTVLIRTVIISQEEGWVVCRAFKKRATSQSKNTQAWESMSFYDEPSGTASSVVDSLDYLTRHEPSSFLSRQNVMCKQELLEAEKLSFSQSDQFVQLPQLHSPSLPYTKRPITSSISAENYKEDRTKRSKNDSTGTKMSTDWRDLDKFVASQLSQEKKYEGVDNESIGMSGFGGHVMSNSEMAMLLLESEFSEDGNRLNEFFNSD